MTFQLLHRSGTKVDSILPTSIGENWLEGGREGVERVEYEDREDGADLSTLPGDPTSVPDLGSC